MLTDYGTTTTADWPEPERIDARRVKPLGTIGRRTFAQLPDGREVELRGIVAAYELGNRPRRSELWIETVQRVVDPVYGKQRGLVEERTLTRAFPVDPGTFAALQAAERAKQDAKAQAAHAASTPHYIDAAELLPALARTPEQAVGIGVSDDPLRDVLGKSSRMAVIGGRPQVRGIAAIRAWLEARGLELGVAGGYLDVRAPKLDADTLAVLDVFRPLLAAELPCALKHKTPELAYTLTAGGRMPICQRHLEGER